MTSSVSLNRTGTRAARARLAAMIDTDGLPADDRPAPGPTDEEMRFTCIDEARPVGTVVDQPTAPTKVPLLDSLGGRLAFERGGVRLYEAVLRKAEVLAHDQGLQACIADLQRIRDEEAEHADLLERVIVECEGDPTLETPCADLEGVMSSGLLQVVHDPRTTLLQCLRAALVAELADLENWSALIRRVQGLVPDALAEEIAEALAHEQEHLALIRTWITTAEQSTAQRAGRAQ
jgi:rubrerythrin